MVSGNGETKHVQKQRRNTAGLKPWPKGVSGNPGGRPKGPSISRLIQAMSDADAKKIAVAAIKAAQKGKFAYFKEIIDRIDGQTVRKIEADVQVSAKALPTDVLEDVRNAAAFKRPTRNGS